MEIKRIKPVIIIVLPLLALVIIRSFGTNHFKTDAARLAKASLENSSIIAPENIQSIPGEKIIINLGNGQVPGNISSEPVKVAPASILEKQNLKLFSKGSVLLWSEEPGVAARIWMLLSQMGYEKVFIVENGTANEVFKKEFRRDTVSIRPEF
jgi:hypothetical protein